MRYNASKYHAKKVVVDGVTYDSKKEYNRYCELLLLEKAGKISNLRRQVKYELIPTQREAPTRGPRGALRDGKIIERPIAYVADFVYCEGSDEVVEDAKGQRTKEYIIKRKLMLYIHKIRIRET